ncbi:MAG: hypothetical protein IJT59_02430 [Desulfovibrionaceae bacterium]|nr:hypothetical protein [Desulfovibrionaceae bacterium]
MRKCTKRHAAATRRLAVKPRACEAAESQSGVQLRVFGLNKVRSKKNRLFSKKKIGKLNFGDCSK